MWSLSQECKTSLMFESQCIIRRKRKNGIVRSEKAFDKIQPFLIKILSKLDMIKGIY